MNDLPAVIPSNSWRTLALSSQADARGEVSFETALSMNILPIAYIPFGGVEEIQIAIPDDENAFEINSKLKLILKSKSRLIPFNRELIRKSIITSYQTNLTSLDQLVDEPVHKNAPSDINFSKQEKRSVPEYFRNILLSAFSKEASDIHISTKEKNIRFRINGELIHWRISSDVNDSLLRHIQILCMLDITEHTRPQDGAFSFQVSNLRIRARVSIVHLPEGAKIAIRILHHYLLEERDTTATSNIDCLHSLGLRDKQVHFLEEILEAKAGLFLVSGTTGSGKSTLLYSLAEILSNRSLNIYSIEDPIEKQMNFCT